MTAAGAPGPAAWTIVFGDPAAGARCSSATSRGRSISPCGWPSCPTGPHASAIVLRPMESLLGQSDLATKFTRVLRSLAAESREAASEL